MRFIIPFKLVRDKIPTNIEARGGTAFTKTLDNVEYARALRKKLIEEAREATRAATKVEIICELADLLEVVEAIRVHEQIPEQEIVFARKVKATSAGTFEERQMLLFAYGGN